MKKRIQFWRPAIAAFLMMMAVALPTTALSFFNQPVAQALGVGLGSFTIYYSITIAAGALTAPLVGQFVSRRGVCPVVVISGIWGCLGFWLYSFSSSLIAFYIVAAAMGALSTSCMSLCANVTVQSSYPAKDAAGTIGVVMAGSGISGMIVSIMIPWILTNWGWRMGYRVLGVFWLGLLLLAAWILGKPENAKGQVRSGATAGEGMTYQQALHSKVFYILITFLAILGICSGISQHIPSILNSVGYTAQQTATLMSIYTALLAVGKIFQGWLYGKVGIKKGGLITLAVYLGSCLLLGVKTTAIPALLLLAIGSGIMTTLPPLVGKTLFGMREYAAIWGIASIFGSVGSFLGTPAWGTAYDITGSYLPALLCSAGLLILTMILHSLMLRNKQAQ